MIGANGGMPGDTEPNTEGLDRRALLAQRLRERIAERNYPLSYPQQRLWFLDQLDPGNQVYLIPLVYRINGPLDPWALSVALTGVVRRHQVLRTVFRTVEMKPRQFVGPPTTIEIPVRDLSTLDEPKAEAERLARAEAAKPFDLTSDLMIRPLLLKLASEQHWLCLTVHHIACDGWSVNLLAAELSELYRAQLTGTTPDLPTLPEQYVDFAEHQVTSCSGDSLEEMLGYWREKLAGAPAIATLPTDHPRPPAQSHAGAHTTFDIPPEITGQVGALARRLGATPFAVLLAAFSALVHAYTGGTEVIVGSPVAARMQQSVQWLIGFFANTVVQRIDVSGVPTFERLVKTVRDESRSAVANQDLPFEKLVDELKPSRDPAYNPVFQLMFSYHDGQDNGLRLPGCAVRMVPGDTRTAKFDLTLSITRHGNGMSARLEYATDLFEQRTAEALGDQFTTLLAAAVAHPDRPIGALPLLSREERTRVLRDWNPPTPRLPERLVHELIEDQVERTPDAAAVLGAGQTAEDALTYRELDNRASLLAARLREAGATPDRPVGVYLGRSPDLVVALLAILKSGAAYLPLDPDYPADRIAFMVDDSHTATILTRTGLARRLTGLPATPLCIDEAAEPVGCPSATLSPDNLAYVIYTSGSTGRPKGVQISHRNVLTFFAGMDRVLDGDDPGSWLAVTSMSFDISVLELLWTLANGYRVVVRGDAPSAGSAVNGTAQVPASVQARPMEFSMFYFGGDRGGDRADAYRLLMEGAKFADRNDFAAVWTPERHFHEFGGLYPNPSVTAAAVAAITEKVAVRAGSVVLPLHDPLRVAEEWSVVDNISHGRAGISIASGWQPNDFVLAPDDYADRKQIMMTRLAELRALWRGGSTTRRNGAGADVNVSIFPPPVQRELPVWITSARSVETFQMAGEVGAGLLTHLLGHSIEQLGEKIEVYRKAWREGGHEGAGHVTLMLHTFVGADVEAVREIVREPLCAYLKSSLDLLAGLGQTMGRDVDLKALPEEELDELVTEAFDRFFATSGLLGTPEHCADLVDSLKVIEVDEVACLVDFGVGHDQVIEAFDQLGLVRELSERRRVLAAEDEPIPVQLRKHSITHLQCTPSMAMLLADDADTESLSGLRRLLVGGEALPGPLAASLGTALPGRVRNMYGPTEATVWATTSPVVADGNVTIGTPMAGVRCYVVDAYFRPAPVNVPGELLLGGSGIARGYLGRAALTAERFVPDPFSGLPGARLYRTGDLVRWLPSGQLEYLGRLDDQVKILGHRIELGEIENTLRAHASVQAAVVSVRGDDAYKRMIAYCVPVSDDAPPTADALRAFCARTLPDYMVPAGVVFLSELPLTPNGKVDRARLPDPDDRPRVEYRPPGDDTEQRIADVFAEVLQVERIGADDNFFDVGGNSLLAVQARLRLRPVLGERLSLVDMFRYPTVRGLAAAFAGDGATAADGMAEVRAAAGRRAGALAARQARRKRERGGG